MASNNIVQEFNQGDTPTWGLTVYTDITKTTTIDTTGWQAWITFKSDKDDTDANAELQLHTTNVSANGILGLIALRPTIEESSTLAYGRYYYDFQIRTSEDILWTVENDRVKVKQAITATTVT